MVAGQTGIPEEGSANVRFGWRAQPVTATPLVVYRQEFRTPRSCVGVDGAAARSCSGSLARSVRDRFRAGNTVAQTVGVLVAAALPRAVWIAEIDLHVGSDGEALVVGHLLAAIPGQGAAQLLRQFAHMFRERADHGCGVPARDLEKHHKAGMALDERRDVRVVCPGEKISFPVT